MAVLVHSAHYGHALNEELVAGERDILGDSIRIELSKGVWGTEVVVGVGNVA